VPWYLRGGSHRTARPVEQADGSAAAASSVRSRLQDALWRGAGVVRTEDGLLALLRELEGLAREAPAAPGRAAGELRNLLEVGSLVAAAALRRRESRGCHYRADHPAERAELAQRPRYRAADLFGGARHGSTVFAESVERRAAAGS
jgi:aspartate oxidase